MSIPTIIEAVEFRREQYGLNQRQMALVLGMGPSHYNEFIKGKRELPKHSMAQAFAFGVPAERLFQTEPNKGVKDVEFIMKLFGENYDRP